MQRSNRSTGLPRLAALALVLGLVALPALAVQDTELADFERFEHMLEAGGSKAEVGDKTMIDALVPAVEAISAAATATHRRIDHTSCG